MNYYLIILFQLSTSFLLILVTKIHSITSQLFYIYYWFNFYYFSFSLSSYFSNAVSYFYSSVFREYFDLHLYFSQEKFSYNLLFIVILTLKTLTDPLLIFIIFLTLNIKIGIWRMTPLKMEYMSKFSIRYTLSESTFTNFTFRKFVEFY